jgi:hypothetical protein
LTFVFSYDRISENLKKNFMRVNILRIFFSAWGKKTQYGKCPNCNNVQHKNSSCRGIKYKENPPLFSVLVICDDCLSNPEKLHIEKIIKNLTILKWDENDLGLAKVAIEKFKSGDKSLLN